MKTLALALVMALSPIALAQDHPSSQQDHPSTTQDHPSASAADKAKVLLAKVHDAYKNAKAIQETMTLVQPAFIEGEEDETMELKIVLGSDSGTIVAKDEMSATWVDGKIYVEIEGLEDAYVSQDATSFTDGLFSVSGQFGMPGLWTLALREQDSFDAWLTAFSMGTPGTEVVEVIEGQQEDGAKNNIIELQSMMGTVNVTVADNNTVTHVTITMAQPGSEGMTLTMDSEVAFLEEMPSVTFAAEDREAFASLVELFAASMPEEVADELSNSKGESTAGGTAPDFTLARMDGSGDVTLSSLKGSVVVLDFWSTWCTPCKRGLPFLNEFDAWIKEEGLNVRVFAVNIWENGDAETVSKNVSKFWLDNKFKTTVLMGSGDDKLVDKYKISGIPTMVIVGVDGTIADQHSGFGGGEAMIANLKELVTKALGGTKK